MDTKKLVVATLSERQYVYGQCQWRHADWPDMLASAHSPRVSFCHLNLSSGAASLSAKGCRRILARP
jgi:hypothetical protein